jgi:hypothetical protein
MLAIKARVTNGYLVSIGPVDLPEGAELEVTASPPESPDMEQMTEDNWPTTADGTARLLARMASREPLQLSEDEAAQWERVCREEKEWELAHADERDERLRKAWE